MTDTLLPIWWLDVTELEGLAIIAELNALEPRVRSAGGCAPVLLPTL